MRVYRNRILSPYGRVAVLIPTSTTTPPHVAVSRTTEEHATRYRAGFTATDTASAAHRFWIEYTPDDLRQMFVVWSRDPQCRRIMQDALALRADDAAPLEMSTLA